MASLRSQAGWARRRPPIRRCRGARRCCRSTPATTRPTVGTPMSRSSTAFRKHRCCGRCPAQLRRDHHLGVDRGSLRAVARAAARAHREPVGGAHQSVRLRPRARRPRGTDGHGPSSIARNSCRTTTRRNIRWCGCTLKPGSECCCSATSSARSSGWAPNESAHRCSTCCRPGLQAGEHDSLELAAGRFGDLGQSRHPTPCRRGLRRSVPAAQPRHAWQETSRRHFTASAAALSSGTPRVFGCGQSHRAGELTHSRSISRAMSALSSQSCRFG